MSAQRYRPRDLADVIGFVGQDSDASFVADTVEDELAYAMENLGVDRGDHAPAGVEDVLDVLNLHALRHRAITTLSGGQRQRVAIGAAFTAAPPALVLDEPTSSLDPVSAEEVLASLARLVHDPGVRRTRRRASSRARRAVRRFVVSFGPTRGDVVCGTPAAIFHDGRARAAGRPPGPD